MRNFLTGEDWPDSGSALRIKRFTRLGSPHLSTKTISKHFIQSAPSQLMVAVTRPARWLGLTGSIAAGTLAYVVDKKLFHHIHPALPRFLGLKQAFFSLQDCVTAHEAQMTLQAAAAAPPFMSGVHLQGAWAFDGGYTDNAPIPVQTDREKASTLVLLTRHYTNLPAVFKAYGRTYWQPSRKIPVSTWDCRPNTSVEDAFALGQEDARQSLLQGDMRLGD